MLLLLLLYHVVSNSFLLLLLLLLQLLLLLLLCQWLLIIMSQFIFQTKVLLLLLSLLYHVVSNSFFFSTELNNRGVLPLLPLIHFRFAFLNRFRSIFLTSSFNFFLYFLIENLDS